MDSESYEIDICGVKRSLPMVKLRNNLSIASFVILGDVEVVQVAAKELADKLPPADYLVTAEAKGIPFVFALAERLGMPRYIVARKSIKPYMRSYVLEEVFSITTQTRQLLCLDGEDARRIAEKRVVIVDDVISTGKSLEALEHLMEKAGATVVGRVAILAEGEAAKRDDIIYLQPLPLFVDGVAVSPVKEGYSG